MVIDFHHHLLAEEGYEDTLLRAMDQAGIDIACVSGLGVGQGAQGARKPFDCVLGDLSADNGDVARAAQRHPGRLIGLGVIRLGKDPAEKVDELRDAGFKGLKIARSGIDYDNDLCMPVYERAEQLSLPILFHTGMQLLTPYDREDDVSSARMRPILLDRVARHFPKLRMVLAHLGMPWHEEAAMMARFHRNVYVDLTAGRLGWRNRLSPGDFHRLFYWEGAFKKIVFGTDTHARDIGSAKYDQELLYCQLNIDRETQRMIFESNAKGLLGMP